MTIRDELAAELMREMVRHRAAPGNFLVRLVDGGPLVAAKVEHGEDGWRTIVDGEPMPWHPDPAYARRLEIVAMRGVPCSEGEYRYRLERSAWAKAHDGDAPESKPMERFDHATAKPIF